MSMSPALAKNEAMGALMEKVILGNDLSGLSPIEKVTHINNVCASLGLNPLTKPIQIMKLSGKEVPYVTKDATEQLRNIKSVAITGIDTKIVGDVYIVIASAKLPNGRSDSSTGVISIAGLKGEPLCNEMMKDETKAKRRVTLSICGLGYIDESEVESIPGAVKVNVYEQADALKKIAQKPAFKPIVVDDDIVKIHIVAMQNAKTIDELKQAWAEAMHYARGNRELAQSFVIEKDACRGKLTVSEFNAEIDAEDVPQ